MDVLSKENPVLIRYESNIDSKKREESALTQQILLSSNILYNIFHPYVYLSNERQKIAFLLDTALYQLQEPPHPCLDVTHEDSVDRYPEEPARSAFSVRYPGNRHRSCKAYLFAETEQALFLHFWNISSDRQHTINIKKDKIHVLLHLFLLNIDLNLQYCKEGSL